MGGGEAETNSGGCREWANRSAGGAQGRGLPRRDG